MFIDRNLQSIFAENYRKLKSNINYIAEGMDIKTIAITSCVNREGKTTVALNLAYLLASSGEKVMLLECDLRNPEIEKKLNLDSEYGLTDMAVSDMSIEEIINESKYGFDVIKAGSNSLTQIEFIGSKNMENILETLKEKYDFVIIDTSAIKKFTDASIIASKSDATILVTRANFSKEADLERGYDELSKAKANIIGSIINAV